MISLTFGEQVKIILGRKGMTIKELASIIEERTGKKMSRQNLTQRLNRDNFQEQDMRFITEILECSFQLNILDNIQIGESMDLSRGGEPTSRELKKVTKNREKKAAKIESGRDVTLGELVDMADALDMAEKSEALDDTAAVVLVPEADEAEAAEIESSAAIDADVETEEADQIKGAAEAADDRNVSGTSDFEAVIQKEIESPAAEPEPEPEPVAPPQREKRQLGSLLKGYLVKSRQKSSRQIPETKFSEDPVNIPEEESLAAASLTETGGLEEKDEFTTYLAEVEVSPETEQSEETEAVVEAEVSVETNPEEVVTESEPREEEEDLKRGEVNPYTGHEYLTNSVRIHPKRIGYVQVYDRVEHGWTDMTEWAFLGYQERKKALLGKDYEPPIYLD